MYCFFACSLLIFVFFVLLILLLPLTTYLDDCCSLLTLQLLVGVSIQNIIYSIRFWILGGANDNFVVGRMYLIYSIKYWKIRKDTGHFCIGHNLTKTCTQSIIEKGHFCRRSDFHRIWPKKCTPSFFENQRDQRPNLS